VALRHERAALLKTKTELARKFQSIGKILPIPTELLSMYIQKNAGKTENQENRVQKGVFEGNNQRSAGTRQRNYSNLQNTVEPSEIAPWDA
jgi:hypothetical protein